MINCLIFVDVLMYCLIMQCGENVENMKSKLMLCIIESILDIHPFMSPICGEYAENMYRICRGINQ